MNNELERILGEVADSASRRTGTLPIGELRARGVRRRRTRQAGYSVVGVAAAFGLAFGAAQILPDGAAVGPADSPSPALPTANSSVPLGACGSVVSNLPVFDSEISLELAPTDMRISGGRPEMTMTLYNHAPEPLDLGEDTFPYLIVARDDVVVGFVSPEAREPIPLVSQDEPYTFTEFGWVLMCVEDEIVPSDTAGSRVPLAAGEYRTFAALGSSAVTEDDEWAFTFLGASGTLTVAEPSTDAFAWPPVDPTAPAGACGADAPLPLFDPVHPLDITPRDLQVARGVAPSAAVRLEVSSTGIEDTVGTGPYLLAVRQDGVVVGYSWLRDAPGPSRLSPGEHEWDNFGPFVICQAGELAPYGGTDGGTPLPTGEYVLWVAHQYEMTDTDAAWAFQNIEHAGRLTITEAGSSAPDLVLPTAVDVELPVCGEAIASWDFPDRVHVDPDLPLAVTVGHTGEDADGLEEFYGEGYGDQLRVTFDHVNQVEPWGESRELDAAVVVARDGVVVAEMSWPQWSEVRWNGWPQGEGRSIGPVGDWVDCASGEHGQVPKGDYEILGWRTVEVTRPDGSTGTLTIGYPAAPFTAYDFEDPDNPGPSID